MNGLPTSKSNEFILEINNSNIQLVDPLNLVVVCAVHLSMYTLSLTKMDTILHLKIFSNLSFVVVFKNIIFFF